MSGKRYTEEFKIAAVKQVAQRGYPVSEVAERLNASIRELTAIGRNINQIAKILNQRPGEKGLSTELVASLSAEMELIDPQFANL